MSKASATYMKRELRKVLPVFILAVLSAIFVFVIVYLTLVDNNTNLRLNLAYMEGLYMEGGDLFIAQLYHFLDKCYFILMAVIELLLIQRVFYLENRAGVSDFLKILPVKETHKILMKVCAGELVIFGYCAVFGIAGTIANALLSPGLAEINMILSAEGAASNACAMLWHMAGMIFLSMSAIFLVMFVIQCCIHNVPLATAVGIGFLCVPYYYSMIYYTAKLGKTFLMQIVSGLFCPYTYVIKQEFSEISETAYITTVEWQNPQKIRMFLIFVIVTALVALAAALYFRWNLRESNTYYINSPGVREFIITGFSVSVGTAMALATGHEMQIVHGTVRGQKEFFCITLVVAAIVWGIFHVVTLVRSSRRRGA